MMKVFKSIIFSLTIAFLSCTANISSEDKEEIQNLIRKALTWANSENSIDLLPAISDSKDSIYIGFDFEKHRNNLRKLKETDLFSMEFINNYDSIIKTIDSKVKNHEYETWYVGELPPFNFTMDVNPWCQCQDIPYDVKEIWKQVEITVKKISKSRGELIWNWGNTEFGRINSKFNVIKEQGKWKISYMQGFDFNESTN